MATFSVGKALQASINVLFSSFKNNVDNKSGYHPQSPPPC